MTKSYEEFQYTTNEKKWVHGGRSCFSWFRTVKDAESVCHLTCWEEFDHNMMITKVYKSTGKKSHSAHHGAKSCLLHSLKHIMYIVYIIYHLKSEAQTRHYVHYPFSIRLIDKLFQCQSQQLKNRRWMYRIFLCLDHPPQGNRTNMEKHITYGWWFRNAARKPPGMVLKPCKIVG